MAERYPLPSFAVIHLKNKRDLRVLKSCRYKLGDYTRLPDKTYIVEIYTQLSNVEKLKRHGVRVLFASPFGGGEEFEYCGPQRTYWFEYYSGRALS